eukprot:TRINITY_DN11908_c0_g1_i2.p1 TRINITY_DN11908_c0_g1~~TRINITY_DN11908_c0_g1_i2.p1  ORF type:complete len:361 (-),score=88.05 TRINITY_DN11908_c0_g1_i2:121-1203(-)
MAEQLPAHGRVYNFAAGPGVLPVEVLEEAQKELLNYKGSGRSVMEMSHRSSHFEEILADADKNLRKLLDIPSNYKILFFQGGGTGQFAAVPMNLLGERGKADYLVTGGWSKRAFEEAKLYGTPSVACTSEKEKFTHVPTSSEWKFNNDAAYVYYCANETVYGVEWDEVPAVPDGVPLVCDMSSNFISRKVPVEKYGLIWAGAQKNSGIAGMTVVIIREDLLKIKPVPSTPTVLNYKVFSDNNSLYHTPPTFAIYMAGLVYKWTLDQGGIEAMEKRNIEKSKRIYDVIEESNGFYRCPVQKQFRSRMNIPFRLAQEKLEGVFIKEAEDRFLTDLAGHRSVGGIRVSLYNAVPLEGVDALAI